MLVILVAAVLSSEVTTPTDPMALARLVGDAFFKESSLPPAPPAPPGPMPVPAGYSVWSNQTYCCDQTPCTAPTGGHSTHLWAGIATEEECAQKCSKFAGGKCNFITVNERKSGMLCELVQFCNKTGGPFVGGKATTYKQMSHAELAATTADAGSAAAAAAAVAAAAGGYGMLAWNYGGALILDGMYESIKQFNFSDWEPQINDYLDSYTNDKLTPGYDLARNVTMPFDGAVGDIIGLFPIAYYQRALLKGDINGQDMAIANLTANHYILQYPHRLKDQTFSRKVTGDWPGQHSQGDGTIVWGDDQTMGTVLVARMATQFKNHAYAAETARQQVGFAKRLRDPVDGLNYHGYNEADQQWSCCKWGRANGWGMLGHAEALQSMQEWPEGYPDEEQNEQIRTIFKQHAAAAKATQAPDGRWHQLLNDTNSFLETSVTAMFLTSIVRGVRGGVLDRDEYDPVIKKAWKGLVSTVLPNGTVTGVCCGTGIQRNAQAYYDRPTFYGCSGPGGAGAVLYAAVDLAKGY